MKRFFAKKGSWFKEGSEAFREEEMFPSGSLFDNDGTSTGSAIYRGYYVIGSSGGKGTCDEAWYSIGYKDGDEVFISEHCTDDEFDIMEG
jgi:hypothetical protein